MLSKSKGQILRVAAAFHILFNVGTPEEITDEISDEAIAASINFVGLCCQQTAFMAGRGQIEEEIQIIKASMLYIHCVQLGILHGFADAIAPSISTGITEHVEEEHSSTPGYCLKLPGKRLNLTALLYAKRFRSHGYKTGALAAFNELEEAGLGSLEMRQTKSGKVNLICFCTKL